MTFTGIFKTDKAMKWKKADILHQDLDPPADLSDSEKMISNELAEFDHELSKLIRQVLLYTLQLHCIAANYCTNFKIRLELKILCFSETNSNQRDLVLNTPKLHNQQMHQNKLILITHVINKWLSIFQDGNVG